MAVQAARAAPSSTPHEPATEPRGQSHPWGRRALIAALAALYIFAWGASGLLSINETDLDAFFLPSARIALAGHPLLVYTLRYAILYPNANGPLSLVPLTAVAALAAHLGWLDNDALRRMLVMATFAVFSLLLAWEGVAAVDRLRGSRLRGWWRIAGYAVFALAPTLWHGVLLYGHVELPLMLWLLLLAIRSLAEARPARGGLSLGLAILARSMAVIYLLPLTALLAARRRWKSAILLGGATVATVTLGLLPFYLAAPHDLLFSLVTFRGALPVGGGSLWGLTPGTAWEPVAQHFDTWFALGTALVVSLVVVLVRRDLTLTGRDVYGLLTLAGVCFPLLIKTLWPYYFLDLYVLSAVWWLGEPGAWRVWRRWLGAVLPAFFVTCALIAEYGTSLTIDTPERWQQSLAITVLLLGFMVVFGARLLLGVRSAAATSAATHTEAAAPDARAVPA